MDNTTWRCIIDSDEKSTKADDPSEVDNRSRFCEQYNLFDGLHTLEVNAHGSTSQTFWFDHLQYIPSASVSLSNAAVYIDTNDPMWNFGPGWIRDSVGYATNQTGAKVDFEFNGESFYCYVKVRDIKILYSTQSLLGISLQWYGYYNATYPFAVTSATYSIDGTTPIGFSLNGVLSQSTNILQNYQLFFTTDTFSAGSHRIEVIYNGDPNSTPLSVQSVVIQNGMSFSVRNTFKNYNKYPAGTSVLSTSNGGTSSTSIAASVTSTNINGTSHAPTASSTGRALPASNSKSSTAEIAGGIVGGVVVGGVVIFVFLAFIFFRKRRNALQSGRVIQRVQYYDFPPEY